MYTSAMLEAESRANGGSVAELSPEGKAYLNQLVREDLTKARTDAEQRIARRVEAEHSDLLAAELDNVALVAEIQAAVASAGSDAPSPASYAEREHRRALEASWQAAGY